MLTGACCIVCADVIDEDGSLWLAAEVLREAPELVVHLCTQQRVASARRAAAVQDGAHPVEQVVSQSTALDLHVHDAVDHRTGNYNLYAHCIYTSCRQCCAADHTRRTFFSKKLSHARFTWNVQSITGTAPPKTILSHRTHDVRCSNSYTMLMHNSWGRHQEWLQVYRKGAAMAHLTALCSAASSSVTKHDGRHAGHTRRAAATNSSMPWASVSASSRAERM